jgi:hypothetical protein
MAGQKIINPNYDLLIENGYLKNIGPGFNGKY